MLRFVGEVDGFHFCTLPFPQLPSLQFGRSALLHSSKVKGERQLIVSIISLKEEKKSSVEIETIP